MKNLALLLVITGCIFISSCIKDPHSSEAFKILTGHIWTSDSLLANKADASGPGGMLEDFKGEVKFNKDLTGNFGIYKGTWTFAMNETQIKITADSLDFPLTTKIVELKNTSLKVTTTFPNIFNPASPINIRMTFKPK